MVSNIPIWCVALVVVWSCWRVFLQPSSAGNSFGLKLPVMAAVGFVFASFFLAVIPEHADRFLESAFMWGCFLFGLLGWLCLAMETARAQGHALALPSPVKRHLPLALASVLISAAILAHLSASAGLAKAVFWLYGVLSALAITLTLALCTFVGRRAEQRADRRDWWIIGVVSVLPVIGASWVLFLSGPLELVQVAVAASVAIAVVSARRSSRLSPTTALADIAVEMDRDPVILVDRAGRSLFSNGAARRLFTGALEDGVDFVEQLFSRARLRSGEPIAKARLFEALDASFSAVVFLDGDQTRLFNLQCARIAETPSELYMQFRLSDVTARERFREAALAARRMESLSHMAGGVAHRFNNLLVSVVGNVDVAKYEIESENFDPQSVREILHDIQVAGMQAAELAKQLVTFTDSHIGKKDDLDLNLTAHEALALIGKHLAPGVSCDVALASSKLMIHADRSQLIEMLYNLVTRAQSAYGEGGGNVRVTTGFRSMAESDLSGLFNGSGMRPGEYVFIEVSEHGRHGPNGANGAFEHVLDQLSQDAYAEDDDLLLGSVLSAAAAHFGGVEARSDSRGGRIVVYLPRLPEDRDVGSERVVVAPVIRETCLVVDDDEDVLNVHKAMLDSLGQTTVATASPVQALEMAKMHRFELALVDVSMPEMRGDELVRLIRQVDPELPVILVSGYADEQEEIERLPGATAFIEKPFGLSELHGAILKVSRSQSEHRADVVSLSLVREPKD